MDVYANIQEGVYTSKIETPARLKKPTMPFSPTPASARKYADELEAYENSKGEIDRIRQERANDEKRLWEQFQADLAEDYGLKGHPKAEKVFSLAQEYASDRNEGGDHMTITGIYEDLAALVK